MTDTPLPVGSIRLYDEIAPLLTAGTYRITTTAEVADANTGDRSAFPPPAADATHLEVGGLRFALGPQDIATMHPPANARGAFGDRLPHVALGRRTLPWERTSAGGAPWLALLVAKRHTDTQAGEVTLQTGPLQATVGATVYGALQAVAPAPATLPVTVAHFTSNRLLRALLPTPEELALLAHVRQVNVADTALDAGDDDGWFSVVTANRLPLDDGAGTDYVALLVSLEGRADLFALPDDDAPAPPVIVLTSWPFTSTGGGTFELLAADLDVGLLGGAAPAATDGTVTLQHTDREGVTAPATYRSPLVPWPPAAAPALPEDDDLTAGAAFEIGRLLGAADGRFTREILAWHRALDHAARSATSAGVVADALGAAPRTAASAPGPGATLGATLLQRLAGVHPMAERAGLHPDTHAALTGRRKRPRRAAAAAAGKGDDDLGLDALSGVRDTVIGAPPR